MIFLIFGYQTTVPVTRMHDSVLSIPIFVIYLCFSFDISLRIPYIGTVRWLVKLCLRCDDTRKLSRTPLLLSIPIKTNGPKSGTDVYRMEPILLWINSNHMSSRPIISIRHLISLNLSEYTFSSSNTLFVIIELLLWDQLAREKLIISKSACICINSKFSSKFSLSPENMPSWRGQSKYWNTKRRIAKICWKNFTSLLCWVQKHRGKFVHKKLEKVFVSYDDRADIIFIRPSSLRIIFRFASQYLPGNAIKTGTSREEKLKKTCRALSTAKKLNSFDFMSEQRMREFRKLVSFVERLNWVKYKTLHAQRGWKLMLIANLFFQQLTVQEAVLKNSAYAEFNYPSAALWRPFIKFIFLTIVIQVDLINNTKH